VEPHPPIMRSVGRASGISGPGGGGRGGGDPLSALELLAAIEALEAVVATDMLGTVGTDLARRGAGFIPSARAKWSCPVGAVEE
jgi:hypothetical protein